MILEKPDARRALRSILQGIVILVLLWLSWDVSDRIASEDGLREVIRWTLGIVALGTIGYIIENGIRSVKGSAFGATFDVQGGEDEAAGAQKVADVAQDKATQIADGAQ